jgi:eukaryotic-like serine/threonine-protein kinase
MNTFTPGTRLGAYEIIELLGTGGMGEVYRARDTALGREVAIKVIPTAFARDAERLRRFVQEAQAAAALDHPNILAIYQIGQHGDAPFIVSELLKGATLRERLHEGALPVRKALDYAIQTARGLAAAHDRGIIHRDLKPENVFVTEDGRVKILDFGVAKLVRDHAREADVTMEMQTGAGTVLGTVGYMSPEQVRGQAVDARSDLFSLGAMLYEMLSGRRPFQRNTAADTMTAVLKEDPPDMGTGDRQLPPVVERIVHRCLEKNPQERFQSARDLAFAIEDMTSVSSAHVAAAPEEPRRAWKMPLIAAGAAVVILSAGTAAFLWRGSRTPVAPALTFQRLTFRRGAMLTARFAPDDKTIVYGAAWDGNEPETFAVTADSPESKSLGLPRTNIHAISRAGELALSLRSEQPFPPKAGVLEQMPLLGGAAPRQIHDGVEYADWAPDGSLAVTLDTGIGDALEYPIGTRIYDSQNPVHDIRVSPDGSLVAFWEPATGGNGITVIDRAKQRKTLTTGWREINGVAWTPAGNEIWFSGRRPGEGWGIFAVTRDGRERLLLRSPDMVMLHDIAADGRVIASFETRQGGIRYAAPGSTDERDLSWLDRSALASLSRDGRHMLFTEVGEAGGASGAVYMRDTDGSAAVRLGDGIAAALSPDGRWALTASHDTAILLPTGAGTPIRMKGRFERFWTGGGAWLPDSRGIVFSAVEPKHGPRIYVQTVGGDPKAISPEGLIQGLAVSADGRRVVTIIEHKPVLIDVPGGAVHPLPPMLPGHIPFAFTSDGTSLFTESVNIAATVAKYDIATGKSTVWRTLLPADHAGITAVSNISIAPDERSYAYTYYRRLSELYLISGLR